MLGQQDGRDQPGARAHEGQPTAVPVPADDSAVNPLLRTVGIFALVSAFLIPALIELGQRPGGVERVAVLTAGTVLLYVAVWWTSFGPGLRIRDAWTLLTASTIILLLAIALVIVGGPAWFASLGLAAGAVGRRCRNARQAVMATAGCSVLGVVLTEWQGANSGTILIAALVPPMATFFSYNSGRREALIDELRRTRAELARTAVADERLRIARDLHDLLGHSLSLITLKAELAGRVIAADPDRAAREIRELETVARRSLAEVRQAVTSYRQPRLAAELATARRMLASADIDCRVDAPESYDLASEVDALLAWTVREGSTNILRHSGARHAVIRIHITEAEAVADLSDDGAGAMSQAAAPGSGLAGLAERAGRIGGQLSAGSDGRRGFRLRVRVPPDRLMPE